jgi:hypothetical protein
MNDLLQEDAPAGTAGVRLLTLNRPERRNALSPDLVTALVVALREADADRDVRAVVLTGAGEKAFCAGGDLGAPSGEGFLGMHEDRGAFAELLKTFRHMKTPSVAAVNGMALGGGFGLVLACDLAVASLTAELGTPEVKRGLFPMMIARLIYEQLPAQGGERPCALRRQARRPKGGAARCDQRGREAWRRHTCRLGLRITPRGSLARGARARSPGRVLPDGLAPRRGARSPSLPVDPQPADRRRGGGHHRLLREARSRMEGEVTHGRR